MNHSADIDKSDDTRLYRVFYRGLPQHRTDHNIRDIPKLSDAISVSREGIYKWLRADYVPPKRAPQIVPLSADAVKQKLLSKDSPRLLTDKKLLRFVLAY